MSQKKTKPKSENAAVTRRLKQQGFDNSYYDRDSGYHKVRCSQCACMVVNSTAIHERGCPNDKSKEEDENG